MSANTIEVQGTLQPEGTLLLDRELQLPPGRVKVTVQPILDYKQTEIWQFFEQIKAERKAQGIASCSQEEIDAYLATMRDED